MRKMTIYEPAMCCPTGLCGVGISPELLRISTVLSALQKKGIVIDRYNLTNSPMKFVTNKKVNELIKSEGVDGLPYTLVDEEVVLTGRYPTNQEISDFLAVPKEFTEMDA